VRFIFILFSNFYEALETANIGACHYCLVSAGLLRAVCVRFIFILFSNFYVALETANIGACH
jgi:hypothetical protein